jgi:hypothetical protein
MPTARLPGSTAMPTRGIEDGSSLALRPCAVGFHGTASRRGEAGEVRCELGSYARCSLRNLKTDIGIQGITFGGDLLCQGDLLRFS